MRSIVLGVLALLSVTPWVIAQEEFVTAQEPAWDAANAEHDPLPEPRVPLSDSIVEAFEEDLKQGVDLLDALYLRMRDYNKEAEGKLYSLSLDNALDNDWLQQTPGIWGKAASEVLPKAGIGVAQKTTSLIAGAKGFIDIVSLSPFPTGDFDLAIRAGLKEVAKSGKSVTVRVLVGWYPGINDGRIDQRAYLRKVIADLKGIPGSKLKIYAGAMQVVPLPPKLVQWNHAKLVAVDGQRVLLGGQNLWHSDYLDVRPVHDLNVAISGPVVRDMHGFINVLWKNVCSYKLTSWWPAYWESGWKDIAIKWYCLDESNVMPARGTGSLRVLGAGRVDALDPKGKGNPADVAMALALRSSKATIRLSQQDLGATDPVTGKLRFWWDDGMTGLAQALVKKQHVYIVLTNDNAKAGSDKGNPPVYWNKIPLTETADKIKEYVKKQPGAPVGEELRKLLCSNLHLAPLRFGSSDKWSNGWTFANHAKFFMIDDSLFYVGSENFYPAPLQEYGVFMNDADAAGKIKAQYWEKLWMYSSKAAISGSEANTCYFK